MNAVKDLDYYKNLQYDVRVRKKGRYYFLFIPELACVVKDERIETAYEKLEEQKNAFFSKMIESGVSHNIEEPSNKCQTNQQPFYTDLFRYTCKLLIAAAVVLTIGVIVLVSAGGQAGYIMNQKISVISNKVKSKAPLLAKTAGKKAFAELLVFAEELNRMPEAEKEKTRLEIRKLVQELKPFFNEAAELFPNNAATEEKQ